MALSHPPIRLKTSENDDPEECTATLAAAFETGYRHVDAARMYGNAAAVEGIERSDASREECIVETEIGPERLDGTDVERIEEIDRERRLIDPEDAP